MTRNDILSEVREIITLNFELEPDLLYEDAEFRAHLGMDSLDLVDLTFFIKHAFGIEEGVHAYKKLMTIGDVVGFVHERKAAA